MSMQTMEETVFNSSQSRANRERLWVLGSLVEFIVTGKESGGEFIMLDVTTWPNFGPPPHIHTVENECFYILDGEFEMRVNDQTVIGKKGDKFYIPAGTPHTFKCVSRRPGRFITIVVGEGLEQFFREVGVPVTDPNSPPTFADDLDEVIASAMRNGMTFPS